MDIGTGAWYTNFQFAPSYSKGSAPYGWWTWRSAGVRIDDTIVNYQSDGSAVQAATFFGSWGSGTDGNSYFAYYRAAAWNVYNGAQNA